MNFSSWELFLISNLPGGDNIRLAKCESESPTHRRRTHITRWQNGGSTWCLKHVHDDLFKVRRVIWGVERRVVNNSKRNPINPHLGLNSISFHIKPSFSCVTMPLTHSSTTPPPPPPVTPSSSSSRSVRHPPWFFGVLQLSKWNHRIHSTPIDHSRFTTFLFHHQSLPPAHLRLKLHSNKYCYENRSTKQSSESGPKKMMVYIKGRQKDSATQFLSSSLKLCASRLKCSSSSSSL